MAPSLRRLRCTMLQVIITLMLSMPSTSAPVHYTWAQEETGVVVVRDAAMWHNASTSSSSSIAARQVQAVAGFTETIARCQRRAMIGSASAACTAGGVGRCRIVCSMYLVRSPTSSSASTSPSAAPSATAERSATPSVSFLGAPSVTAPLGATHVRAATISSCECVCVSATPTASRSPDRAASANLTPPSATATPYATASNHATATLVPSISSSTSISPVGSASLSPFATSSIASSTTATSAPSVSGSVTQSNSVSSLASPSAVTSAYASASAWAAASASASTSISASLSATTAVSGSVTQASSVSLSASPSVAASASASGSASASASASTSLSAKPSVSAIPTVILPPGQRLTSSDGASADLFGYSVSLTSNGGTYVALVGAYWDDVGGNTDQGAAYIFISSNGTSWTEVQRLTASDGAAGDRFGCAVSLIWSDGTYVALVAAYWDDVGGNTNQGAAYIFTSSTATSWTEVQRLTASDGAADDRFGYSVSLSSNGGGYVALVGAYWDDVGNNVGQGSAYVFTSSTATSWTEVQRLTASDGANNDWFGYSMSLISQGGGYVALVGAALDDIDGKVEQGSAYIFTSSTGSNWTQTQRLTASDGAKLSFFGSSVSLMASGGDYVALVGAYAHSNGPNGSFQGAAYIFTSNTATSWTQTQRLMASDGAPNDQFGSSVSLASNGGTCVALVGAHMDDVGGTKDQGSAYVFTGSTATSWTEVQRLSAPDGATGDRLGYSLSLIANGGGYVALLGAHQHGIGANAYQGAAYVVTSNGTNWSA